MYGSHGCCCEIKVFANYIRTLSRFILRVILSAALSKFNHLSYFIRLLAALYSLFSATASSDELCLLSVLLLWLGGRRRRSRVKSSDLNSAGRQKVSQMARTKSTLDCRLRGDIQLTRLLVVFFICFFINWFDGISCCALNSSLTKLY